MANKNTLDAIRKNIEKHLGKKIVLRANKGRKKIVVKEGVIENTYPSIFVVKIDDEYNNTTRVSYSYSDVLTSTVRLEVKPAEGKRQIISGMPN
ncbi:MAG: hypothetical protein GT589_06780 [Peptoclostridium sp.]|uniref:Veg family protein n=1 Tax=Peptoclostridium sp. TaxID=1904860 RepID=UPI00139F0E82|nr:Veg family protein [Peptoclostridium sp.]MZQ75850.1 hypothetical protein [Peptoclostridium sp.]